MTDDELTELYLERAAIMEHMALMPRWRAELAAYRDWRTVVGQGVPAPQKVQEIVTEARKQARVQNG